jgi:8-oxo-dGTP pyrophosphatase MutT (NUDIX family)/DNA-binding transcriptional regulator YhcF (GntR family)
VPVPDYADDRPVYVQIADDLRARIGAGDYAPGDRLPSNQDLSERYHVARETIRQAIEVLRGEKLVAAQSTRGVFVLRGPGEVGPSSEYEAVTKRLEDVVEEVRQLRERLVAVERQVLQGEPSSTPEPQPVVAAIVTSPAGVLVARRQDGKPPWTFIAGEIEPGESPADAAVREVKEETGLRVRAGGIIGRRVHPATKRTMVYMAATPTHGTDTFVGDEDELAEVRWVNLREAGELMGGTIFEPVREHLRRTLPEEPQ